MPICPKCNKEIEKLINFTSGENRYNVWLLNNEPYYQLDTFIGYVKIDEFECPECLEVLFTDETKAVEFLKGYDELQTIVSEKLNKIKEEKKNANMSEL